MHVARGWMDGPLNASLLKSTALELYVANKSRNGLLESLRPQNFGLPWTNVDTHND